MRNDGAWSDAQRIESWAGEVRVNLVRLAALLVFYGHHLLNWYVLDDRSITLAFHNAVTALFFAWAGEVTVLHIWLSRRWVPAWLKYAATACDIVLVTVLLVISRDPHSMLVVLYFLVIMA